MRCDKFDFISHPQWLTMGGLRIIHSQLLSVKSPEYLVIIWGDWLPITIEFTNDIPMNPNQQSFSMVNHYHFANVLMLKSPMCSWFCHHFRSSFWDISHDISHEIPVFNGESPRKITKSPLGSPNPPWSDWSPVEMATDYRLRRSQLFAIIPYWAWIIHQ